MIPFPIGWNIDGEDLRDSLRRDNFAPLFEHLEDLQPSALLVINNGGLADRIKARLPQTHVIVRSFSAEEGGEWLRKSPQQFVAQFQRTGLPQTIKHLTNEPSFNDALFAQWAAHEAETVRLANAAGHQVVAFNTSVGTPQRAWIQRGDADSLIRAVLEGPNFFGCHEYYTVSLPATFKPVSDLHERAKLQPETWLSPQAFAEWVGQPGYPEMWFLFRHVWIVKRALELGYSLDDLRGKFLLTEFGYDDVENGELSPILRPLKDRLGMPRYSNNLRGVNTYERTHTAYFDYWSYNEWIIAELSWWLSLQQHAPWIGGVCLFGLNKDWEDFGRGHDWHAPQRIGVLDDLVALAQRWRIGSDAPEPTGPAPIVVAPPASDTASGIDMLDYVRCAPGRKVWFSSQELLRSVDLPSSVPGLLTWLMAKNEHGEHAGADANWIYKGVDNSAWPDPLIDASERDGYYAPYRDQRLTQYGHRWLPRRMQVGETFETDFWIVWRYEDGTLIQHPRRQPNPHPFRLRQRLVRQSSLTIAGQTVQTIEIEGFAGESAVPFERWTFGLGWGYLRWERLEQGQVVQTNQAMQLSQPAGVPEKSAATIAGIAQALGPFHQDGAAQPSMPPLSDWQTVRVNVRVPLNIRSRPKATPPRVGVLQAGQNVRLEVSQETLAEPVRNGRYLWWAVRYEDAVRWIAQRVVDGPIYLERIVTVEDDSEAPTPDVPQTLATRVAALEARVTALEAVANSSRPD